MASPWIIFDLKWAPLHNSIQKCVFEEKRVKAAHKFPEVAAWDYHIISKTSLAEMPHLTVINLNCRRGASLIRMMEEAPPVTGIDLDFRGGASPRQQKSLKKMNCCSFLLEFWHRAAFPGTQSQPKTFSFSFLRFFFLPRFFLLPAPPQAGAPGQLPPLNTRLLQACDEQYFSLRPRAHIT